MASSVFVTGANGYIGQAVAIALRNAGYRVYGLVRSADKGKHLISHEVIPVVGELSKPDTYHEVLDKVTYVIDNALDFTSQDPFTSNKILVEATAKSATHQVAKTYIYTSGILVYTHSEDVRDENTSLHGDFPFFEGRIAFEQYVRCHTGVRGLVIRPGFVYGGSSGAGNLLTTFFENGKKEKIVINNQLRSKRWSWIHVVDLADAYVRAVKRSHSLQGEAFNIVSYSAPTYEEIILASAKIAGFKGTVEYSDAPGTDFVGTLGNKTVRVNYKKAEDLLGWTPNHLGVLEELELFYHTIKGEWH